MMIRDSYFPVENKIVQFIDDHIVPNYDFKLLYLSELKDYEDFTGLMLRMDSPVHGVKWLLIDIDQFKKTINQEDASFLDQQTNLFITMAKSRGPVPISVFNQLIYVSLSKLSKSL